MKNFRLILWQYYLCRNDNKVPANATVSEAHDPQNRFAKTLDDMESLYDIIIHVDPIENLQRIS